MKKRLFVCILLTLVLIVGGGMSVLGDDIQVVALMYHNVTEDESSHSDWCISPAELDADIGYFIDQGYITMTATELATADINTLYGKKILLLTFDDGYTGFYTKALPVLQKYQAKATMFVISSYIDRYGYLSKEQVKALSDSGLVEIGNHTDRLHQKSYEELNLLYKNYAIFDEIVQDIRSNGQIISQMTGKPVTSMSYPYGLYTSQLDEAVKKELGYKISFSTKYGVIHYNGKTSVPFNRINREHGLSPQDLHARIMSLW